MASESRPSYPYGYKPIQASKGSYRVIPGATLPEGERQRAINRRQTAKNMKSYKVLLIGESGVGNQRWSHGCVTIPSVLTADSTH